MRCPAAYLHHNYIYIYKEGIFLGRSELLEEFLFPRVSEIYCDEDFKDRYYRKFGIFTISGEDSYSEESAP